MARSPSVPWRETVDAHRHVLYIAVFLALGRFSFTFLALEHLRPFLGPFYSWVAALPRNAFVPIPMPLLITARYLASVLQTCKGARVVPSFSPRPQPISFMAILQYGTELLDWLKEKKTCYAKQSVINSTQQSR